MRRARLARVAREMQAADRRAFRARGLKGEALSIALSLRTHNHTLDEAARIAAEAVKKSG